MATEPTQGAVAAEWYREHRRQVEASFTDAHLVDEPEDVHSSPSGKYRLVVRDYRTRDGCWRYTRGLAYAGERKVADVKRNYGIFHFGWAEGNSSGHDYLLCGEDYQGQTVVELDTGRRADYVHESARGGGGFCCAKYYPSPDRRLVVIDGCVWAAPYELVMCRFDDPMTLPWPELGRAGLSGEPEGWTAEGFVFESSEDVRLTDGKAFDELSDEEQDDFWKRRAEVGGERRRRYLWTPTGERRLLGKRVVRASG